LRRSPPRPSIDDDTLRKHFREEIDTGAARALTAEERAALVAGIAESLRAAS
jgi:hypothetical protein